MAFNQQINPNYISANNTTSGQVLTSNGTATVWANSGSFFNIIDDISGYFDGANTSFVLTYNNGTQFTPTSPYQLTVYIGNIPVTPARNRYDYFNLPEVSVFNSGFYISGNTINFATAPSKGMSFSGTIINTGYQQSTFSYKQTPFNALSIMLGS
jgi:hypothetical protein